MARTAARHARVPEPRARWGPSGRAAGRAAGSVAGTPPGPVPAVVAVPAPAPVAVAVAEQPVTRRLGLVLAALALLAVGVAAVVVAVVVDELGTGGRVVAAVVALWALLVGGSALRR